MNGALETLVSQAHGAGELGLCGTIFKRGWLITTVLHVPITILLSFTGQICLTFLGQDAQVSEFAQLYVMLSVPKYYFLGMGDMTCLWLGCFKITLPPMIIQFVSVCLHLFCLEYLVVQ